jgi:hypothetical protein
MRLCDELAELSRYGELAVCGVFADLCGRRTRAWRCSSAIRHSRSRRRRVWSHLRESAARSGFTRALVTEPTSTSSATLADVAAASRFAARYLVGESLRSIDVPRLARSA